MTSIGSYAIVLAVTAGVTFATVPIAIRLARRLGAVVQPAERRVHTVATPTLGGGAMFLGVAAGLITAGLVSGFKAVFETPANIWGVVGGAVIIFAAGWVDDIREVSAPAKVAGMVLSGSVLALAGISIVNLPLPFVGFTVLSPDLAVVLSVAWVVVMANAVNLIDGLDGLAAGIVAIAAGSFLLYGIKLDRVGALERGNIGPLISVIVVGICLGFLPWNFHPAKIFMGDSGALLLGLLMASSTIAVGGQSDASFTGQSWFFFAPLVIPLIILGVPILDMVFAVLRRTSRRKGFATADKDHLHHRLLRLGHSQRRSVLILWGFTALLSAFALYPVVTNRGSGLLPIAVLALALMLFTTLVPWFDRRRAPVDQRRPGEEVPVLDLDGSGAVGESVITDGPPDAAPGAPGPATADGAGPASPATLPVGGRVPAEVALRLLHEESGPSPTHPSTMSGSPAKPGARPT